MSLEFADVVVEEGRKERGEERHFVIFFEKNKKIRGVTNTLPTKIVGRWSVRA